MSVLSSKGLLEYFGRPEDRLVVTPILQPEEQISTSAIDLRLGSEFIVMSRTEHSTLEMDNPNLEVDIEKVQEFVYIGLGEKFVLHPQELVLGGTLEYIYMPKDLFGYVIGRSSWGRLGLVVATATGVHPGFRGSLTLELINIGNIPIELNPGWRIAQLVFHEVKPPEPIEFQSKYIDEERWVGPTSPGFSEIYKDKEKDLLIRKSVVTLVVVSIDKKKDRRYHRAICSRVNNIKPSNRRYIIKEQAQKDRYIQCKDCKP